MKFEDFLEEYIVGGQLMHENVLQDLQACRKKISLRLTKQQYDYELKILDLMVNIVQQKTSHHNYSGLE